MLTVVKSILRGQKVSETKIKKIVLSEFLIICKTDDYLSFFILEKGFVSLNQGIDRDSGNVPGLRGIPPSTP